MGTYTICDAGVVLHSATVVVTIVMQVTQTSQQENVSTEVISGIQARRKTSHRCKLDRGEHLRVTQNKFQEGLPVSPPLPRHQSLYWA